ncbi:hypothetical protein ACG5V6_05610 [Streptomyces chitinivorans]|uniref:Uncharacterized protein n=1 Tax=Streptomyces chitinivorans TaxID=1257027 RepID=A0ABW7HP99_9ACTN|nr:hypothetical protein [Streptomyces chitinivorans]MDH2410308.1 hypothetical protein [Streptomyces chitinivorans]
MELLRAPGAPSQAPRLFGPLDGSYRSLVTYLHGLAAGTRGALLTGFREWLILRAGRGSNLVWAALVLLLAFPDSETATYDLPDEESDRIAVDTLFRCLDTFLTDRDGSHDGLRQIYSAYEEWLPQ